MMVVIVCVCMAMSVLLGLAPYLVGGAVALAIALFIICFVSTEASLYVLIFSMLLSPEFGMGALSGPEANTGDRGVTIRTEDLLLVVMCFAWLVRMAVHKELGLVRETPLAEAAHERSKAFGVDSMIEMIETMYQDLLSRSTPELALS